MKCFFQDEQRGAAKLLRRLAAFSLVEFVGMLAIIAIVVALVYPVVIRRVDIAAVNAESASLNSLNNALVLQILRSNSIPSEATWAQTADNWLAFAPNTITTNKRRYARAFLIDTNGWLGANLPATGYYVQTNGGTLVPNGARMMLVSSLSASLPVVTGRPSTASFNDIWNTAPNTVPSTWTSWKGRADDLVIQRMNLQPLFCQLILANRDTNNAAAYYINTTNSFLNVPAKSTVSAYYLSGSVVGLSSSNSAGQTIQSAGPLTFNSSFVFENGMWNNQIGNGPTNALIGNVPIGSTFNLIASNFVNTAENPNAGGSSGKGGDQQQVLASMVNFMTAYQLWANNPNGSFTTYSIGVGTNYDSMFYNLQNAASMLSQTAGQQKQPNAITGLLQ